MLEWYMSRDSRSRKELWHDEILCLRQPVSVGQGAQLGFQLEGRRRSRSTHGRPSSARSMPGQAPGWCMARAARWRSVWPRRRAAGAARPTRGRCGPGPGGGRRGRGSGRDGGERPPRPHRPVPSRERPGRPRAAPPHRRPEPDVEPAHLQERGPPDDRAAGDEPEHRRAGQVGRGRQGAAGHLPADRVQPLLGADHHPGRQHRQPGMALQQLDGSAQGAGRPPGVVVAEGD